MSMTDPVADFLTRVRNGLHAQRQDVLIPSSRLKRELARILTEEGYINSYEEIPPSEGRPGGEIRVTLKYTGDRVPVISGLERVSRPGRRTYVDHSHIPRIQGGMGTAIISTSSGVMTGHEARHRQVGGEVVARVW
jgi:small subunit ribosomal protein S8